MRVEPYSLIARLSRTLSLWVGGVWILTSIGAAWYVHHELSDRFDELMVESARLLLDIAVHEVDEIDAMAPSGPVITKEVPDSQSIKVENAYLVYQVLDGSRNMIFRSAAAPATQLVADLKQGFMEGQKWRTYTLRHATRDFYIVVADTHTNRYAGFRETMPWLLVILIALLPLILFAVRKITSMELHSVRRMATEISARSGTDLSPITVGGMSTELSVISESTNHLLVRLDEALKSERALAANAAHELRTPLAAARLSLSSAQTYPMSEAAREATIKVRSSLDVLAKRAEKLLQLSRAEASASLTQERVDLGLLVCAVVDEFAQSAQAADRIKLSMPAGEVLTPLGDFDSLAIAMRNLIENSLKYAPESDVFVQLSGPATFSVRDTGPGVNAQDMQRLRERHVRLSSDQAGYGLGLSIVRTIIEKQGGELKLYSPPLGHAQGFEAILVLKLKTHALAPEV
jgi:two-component system, OmpR family, sensor kinase